MKVTVYYDYICPFCYLGTKRILELSKEFDLTIDWKGIEIHPEFPPQGKKRTKTLKSQSFGKTVRTMAKEDNIEIRLPGFATNSRLALEGSEFAKVNGRFIEFHKGVYEAYYVEGRNIGDIEVIIDIGDSAGLDKSELAQCLDKRTMFDEIKANKKHAEDNNVLGVPTFILGSFPVHGNQSTQTMRHLIKRALEKSQD